MQAQFTWLKHHWLISTALCLALAGTGGGAWLYVASHPLGTLSSGGACGTVGRGFAAPQSANPQTERADAQEPIIDCFWHAFANCVPATLTYLDRGVDTNYRDDLSITGYEQPCAISVSSDHRAIGRETKTSFRCASLSRQNTWLVLAPCDHGGSVTLEPDIINYGDCPSTETPDLVGAAVSPAQVRCFVQGYQSCSVRSLTSGSALGHGNVWYFWMNSYCTISASNDNPFVVATCRDFKQTVGRLSFLGCGQFGDLFVPVSLGG